MRSDITIEFDRQRGPVPLRQDRDAVEEGKPHQPYRHSSES